MKEALQLRKPLSIEHHLHLRQTVFSVRYEILLKKEFNVIHFRVHREIDYEFVVKILTAVATCAKILTVFLEIIHVLNTYWK